MTTTHDFATPRPRRAPRHRRSRSATDGAGLLSTTDPTEVFDENRAGTAPTTVDTSFAALGLPDVLVGVLAEQGITTPFPIQAATVPDALAGRDVLGRGRTGSGKTLAFGLPLLARLAGHRSAPLRPRALVLVPTRELAMQVADALRPFAVALGLFCRTVVGGTSFPKQAEALRRGVDLVIATPGRLLDHTRQGTCVLDAVEAAALDEADHMADLGFLPDVRALLDQLPPGQRLLFSATLDGEVDTLVRTYLTDPVAHSVAPPAGSVPTMEHHLLLVRPAEKDEVTTRIAARAGRTILFARTQHAVDELARKLRAVGVRAGALHGGKSQGLRTRTLAEFREGRTTVLVATDVAARGIHVDGIDLVVHLEPPRDPKDYLHRAGRTARAGRNGTVVTLVLPRQRRMAEAVTRKAGVRVESTRVGPEDVALTRLTGAREPSGVPVVDEPRRPRRRNGDRPEARARRERVFRSGRRPRSESGDPETRHASGGRRRSDSSSPEAPGHSRSGERRREGSGGHGGSSDGRRRGFVPPRSSGDRPRYDGRRKSRHVVT